MAMMFERFAGLKAALRGEFFWKDKGVLCASH
jgi:hypothetical protein